MEKSLQKKYFFGRASLQAAFIPWSVLTDQALYYRLLGKFGLFLVICLKVCIFYLVCFISHGVVMVFPLVVLVFLPNLMRVKNIFVPLVCMLYILVFFNISKFCKSCAMTLYCRINTEHFRFVCLIWALWGPYGAPWAMGLQGPRKPMAEISWSI